MSASDAFADTFFMDLEDQTEEFNLRPRYDYLTAWPRRHGAPPKPKGHMSPITYPNRAAQLRQKLLAQQVAPNRELEIDGEKFFIRTPVLSDRTRIMELAEVKMSKKGDADVSIDRMMAAAAVVLAVDDVGSAVFQPSDLDALRALPIDSWFAELANACLGALNGGTAEAKKSEEAKSDASSISSPTA